MRIFTGVDADNRPSIDLHDSKGTIRESMYLLNDLPVLRLFDASAKRRAELRLDSSQDGELLINDANEKLRLALFRTSNGDPQIGLYGTDEKLRAFFSTDDASPYLVMRDAAGTTRVYAGGYKDGTIGIDVRDASNKVLWKQPQSLEALRHQIGRLHGGRKHARRRARIENRLDEPRIEGRVGERRAAHAAE